jgi:hypothetical protein
MEAQQSECIVGNYLGTAGTLQSKLLLLLSHSSNLLWFVCFAFDFADEKRTHKTLMDSIRHDRLRFELSSIASYPGIEYYCVKTSPPEVSRIFFFSFFSLNSDSFEQVLCSLPLPFEFKPKEEGLLFLFFFFFLFLLNFFHSDLRLLIKFVPESKNFAEVRFELPKSLMWDSIMDSIVSASSNNPPKK